MAQHHFWEKIESTRQAQLWGYQDGLADSRQPLLAEIARRSYDFRYALVLELSGFWVLPLYMLHKPCRSRYCHSVPALPDSALVVTALNHNADKYDD
jgi:hypothetical protein